MIATHVKDMAKCPTCLGSERRIHGPDSSGLRRCCEEQREAQQCCSCQHGANSLHGSLAGHLVHAKSTGFGKDLLISTAQ